MKHQQSNISQGQQKIGILNIASVRIMSGNWIIGYGLQKPRQGYLFPKPTAALFPFRVSIFSGLGSPVFSSYFFSKA